ncbi:hypothetical protein FRX31_006061 [Thalictrum thalictroides]|uniref:Uncharacterized protein n=1 Tax=Thalictrum thalictroides TaxID=46969 RepID=A0A7J6X4P4_THATH|nr:hypothetical protein FRX31_006061 [Thalictrum thalictroides]
MKFGKIRDRERQSPTPRVWLGQKVEQEGGFQLKGQTKASGCETGFDDPGVPVEQESHYSMNREVDRGHTIE